jgi:hypothetical protein
MALSIGLLIYINGLLVIFKCVLIVALDLANISDIVNALCCYKVAPSVRFIEHL